MWLPLFVWKFQFKSVFKMLIYLICNGLLLLTYWIVFAIYLKTKNPRLTLSLAVLPSCIFLLSGILLHHWLLVGFLILFAIGHIYVTQKNVELSVINKTNIN